MGGLYDAATLRALMLSTKSSPFERFRLQLAWRKSLSRRKKESVARALGRTAPSLFLIEKGNPRRRNGARVLEKSLSFFKQENQTRPKAAVRGGLRGSSSEEVKFSRSENFDLRPAFLTKS